MFFVSLKSNSINLQILFDLSWCQFNQRFFARFFHTNVFLGAFSSYILALVPNFRTKNARVNVDEIDAWGV